MGALVAVGHDVITSGYTPVMGRISLAAFIVDFPRLA